MAKGKRKYLRRIIIALGLVCLLFVIGVFVLTMPSPTLDKRIAEFEAKRKIPDSENAAVIYNRLFKNYDCNQLELAFTFSKRDPNLRSKPWLRNDYPEVGEWLKNQQDIISELFKATKLEKCYFPNPFDPNSFSKYNRHNIILRNAAVTLTIAANNDIAEDRLDDAIEKYRCMIKIGQHIYQQPLLFNSYVGWNIEAISLGKLNTLILERNITEQQSNKIEEFPIEIQDTWNNQLTHIQEAENLYEEKLTENLTYFQRIRYSIYLLQMKIAIRGQLFKNVNNSQKLYLRYLMNRRGHRSIIGLRRYKNQNGMWPESLEQIKSLVDPNALVDPWNNGSFVYKLTETGFTLYSKGQNNIDEGGKYNTDSQGKILTDDWMIWPSN